MSDIPQAVAAERERIIALAEQVDACYYTPAPKTSRVQQFDRHSFADLLRQEAPRDA